MSRPLPAITIAGRRIAADAPPYVIAELSANHNGRLDTALAIVDAAKAAPKPNASELYTDVYQSY